MWSNNEGLAKAQKKVLSFNPQYCANPACEWHHPDRIFRADFYIRFGVRKIARYPYVSQRFRCRRCLKTFSESFFSLNFRDRAPDTYEQIRDFMLDGWSGCAISRRLKVTEDTVRRRKKKLARFTLLAMAKDLMELKINESIAYDGLENFSNSQFDPNHLNHAVGRDSYFIYDFNLSPLNRKGRMSSRQKRKSACLEQAFGKYPPGAIETDTQRLLERLLSRTEGDLLFHTDMHPAYRRAIAKAKEGKRVIHCTTPGKATRNFKNRLFAINHTDMLARHKLGNFRRETISFAKNSVAMLESFLLFAAHKNYQRPRFYKKHRRDPLAHKESPAMKLGLRSKIQTFREFYRGRISFHHVKMPEDWINLFDSYDPHSRKTIRPYAGI